MSRPKALYVIPTESLEEDEELESVLVSGWVTPPGVGATVLIVPLKDGELLRRIKWLYTVTSVVATQDKEWPLELGLELEKVRSPQRWYDIVSEVARQGLVPIVGARGHGDRISHQPTIDLILEMLGEDALWGQ